MIGYQFDLAKPLANILIGSLLSVLYIFDFKETF